jgi:hypothetical protein
LYFSHKDLKSLIKKTLENKGEIGKRKQKRKKNRKPAPSQFTPSPRPTSALGPRKVQRPGRLRAHPFPPPWPADGRGPPVSRAPFPYLPPCSTWALCSRFQSRKQRDLLAFFANQRPTKFPLQSRSLCLHRSRKKQALDAPVKLGWISPGPTLSFSVVRASPFSLGPNQALRRDRGELLFIPVFSFRETVLGIEKSVVAGELLPAGNGATAPELVTAG